MPGALLGPFGRYELGSEPVTIGRSSSNKLVIDDALVSGRHLQVLPHGATYLLVDVGSSNGTLFNGQRLAPQVPQMLRGGDSIVIGGTRLMVELTERALPLPPQPAAPRQGPSAPSEQIGFSPAPPDDTVLPVPPARHWPPAPQGGPVRPAAPVPNAFGPPPGQAPGYYLGAPAFGAPPAYQGAPGAGAGPAPVRPGRKRPVLLVSGVLAVLVILAATGLTIFLLSHRLAGPSIPNATTQVVTPFYDDLKRQDYTTATGLFTADYLQQLGGKQQVVNAIFQPLDQFRGAVTDYHIVSVKPVNGSAASEVATVAVTRDPSKGAFNPDTLRLVYAKGKWQISQWMPGMGQG